LSDDTAGVIMVNVAILNVAAPSWPVPGPAITGLAEPDQFRLNRFRQNQFGPQQKNCTWDKRSILTRQAVMEPTRLRLFLLLMLMASLR